MSALATIVGSLGELSESELRQLYLMVGVRLGIPDVPSGSKTPGKATGKARNPTSSGAKSQPKKASSKGNPKRKSQWANHPLYQEYSRLKKVVEAQAKESKLSFNAVDTAESRAYRQAFTDRVNAKSSFRDHSGGGQAQAMPARKEEDDEEESSEEEEEAKPSSSQVQAKPAPPQPSPAGSRKSTPPAGEGKAAAK